MPADPTYPSLAEFLAAPLEDVIKIAPQTMIFAAGGTRRSAVLAGVSSTGDEYAEWLRPRMIACHDLIFRHGVHHIISPIMVPLQWKEITPDYRKSLIDWIDWGISGQKAIADYMRLGWRVRLLGIESLPELVETARRLEAETNTTQAAPTLWFTVAPTDTCTWDHLLESVQKSDAKTQQEAIRARYGEEIPPATLLLSYGKPNIFPALVPPLLMGELQCYWKQQPGYEMDQDTLRAILYDFAYTRSTWRADKSGRAEQVLKHRTIWEQAPVLGLGVRLGPFWYPAPIPPVLDES